MKSHKTLIALALAVMIRAAILPDDGQFVHIVFSLPFVIL